MQFITGHTARSTHTREYVSYLHEHHRCRQQCAIPHDVRLVLQHRLLQQRHEKARNAARRTSRTNRAYASSAVPPAPPAQAMPTAMQAPYLTRALMCVSEAVSAKPERTLSGYNAPHVGIVRLGEKRHESRDRIGRSVQDEPAKRRAYHAATTTRNNHLP